MSEIAPIASRFMTRPSAAQWLALLLRALDRILREANAQRQPVGSKRLLGRPAARTMGFPT